MTNERLSRRVVDLSHPISESMPMEQKAGIRFTRRAEYESGRLAHRIEMDNHNGTHVDAPAHTEPGGISIDQIPPDQLYGDAVVLDLTPRGANEEITLSVVKAAVGNLRTGVQPGDFVLLKTLWADRTWGTREYWTDSPYLDPEAARYLIEEKGARGLGYDFSQERYTPLGRVGEGAPGLPIHHIVLGSGCYQVEAMTNLGAISQERVTIVVAPLPLKGLEASPCRVFAIEETDA
jgi:arylformamidase